MIQIVRVLNYNWVYAQACHNQSKIIAMVYSHTFGLLKNNLLKLIRHCNSKRVYFCPDADTFYSIFIYREKHTKYTHTHTHNDG